MVVEYCVHFLLNVHKLWEKAATEDKYRLQSLLFPDGISPAHLEGKQTPKLSPVLETISGLKNGRKRLAGPRRIELRLAD